jgi:hypothetical protein
VTSGQKKSVRPCLLGLGPRDRGYVSSTRRREGKGGPASSSESVWVWRHHDPVDHRSGPCHLWHRDPGARRARHWSRPHHRWPARRAGRRKHLLLSEVDWQAAPSEAQRCWSEASSALAGRGPGPASPTEHERLAARALIAGARRKAAARRTSGNAGARCADPPWRRRPRAPTGSPASSSPRRTSG